MEILQEFKSEYAVLVVRVIAGILFLAQGYDKVFNIGLKPTGEAAVEALRPLLMPALLVRLVSSLTAILELSCGILLIVGFGILPACYILAACLFPVTIAMSLREPMWNMQHVWTRLVMIVFLLVVPVSVHTISIDHLLGFYAN